MMLHKLGAVAVASLFTVVACASVDDPDEDPRTAAAEAMAAKVPAVAMNLATDSSFNLVTRVISRTGSVVEFYEPSPGVLFTSEIGVGDSVSAFTSIDGLTASEVYQLAAPDLPVPQKLVLAEERAQTVRGQGTVPLLPDGAGPGSPSPGIVVETASAYCDSFQAAHTVNGIVASGGLYTWEYPWAGPGAYANSGGVQTEYSGLCLSTGSTTYTVHRQGDDNGGASWQMAAYSWRWFSHTCGSDIWGRELYNTQINLTGGSGSFFFNGYFLY